MFVFRKVLQLSQTVQKNGFQKWAILSVNKKTCKQSQSEKKS